jgi:transcriptional regulator with XRE-family HTH domain
MKNGVKNTTIGARIKSAREARGLSQADLAKELGFQSATAISLIENDERGVSTEVLNALGGILHRDTLYFLTGKEHGSVDVKVALRADKDLSKEDKDAILRFIDLAKKKRNAKR